jgi:hypothetical protein
MGEDRCFKRRMFDSWLSNLVQEVATMRTKRQPKPGVVVEKQQPTTTRGIHTIDRPGRPHPFGVQWREFDKNKMGRRTEFYGKEAERDKEVSDLLRVIHDDCGIL